MINELKERPLTLDEILLSGYRIFRSNFQIILITVLALRVPVNIIDLYISNYSKLVYGVYLLSILVYAIQSIIMAGMVEQYLLEEKVKPGQIMGLLRRKWKQGMLTATLFTAIIFFWAILLLIPGIIWAVYYGFCVYAVALRNLSKMDALRYSQYLVEGKWWHVFVFTLLFGLIAGITSFVVTFPMSALKGIFIVNLLSNTTSETIFVFSQICSIILFLNLSFIKSRVADTQTQTRANRNQISNQKV